MRPTDTRLESDPHKLSGRVLERSDDVLWSVAPNGAVLHNVATGKYLMLDASGYTAWAYLDGARSAEAVIEHVLASSQRSGDDSVGAESIRSLICVLWAYGFISERSPAAAPVAGGS